MLIKKGAIMSLIIIVPFFSIGQRRIEIRGAVLDSVRRAPIPFANVYLKRSMEGTCTNYEGKFVFRFDSTALNDTLKISYIGYQSIELPLSTIPLSDTLRFNVVPSNTILSEVTVYSSDLSKGIVKRAFESFFKNYPTKRHYYSAFFRETIVQNKQYVRLVEAAVHIEDPGYKRDTENVRIQLDQLRRSSDYSEKNLWEKANRLFFGKSNSLYNTYQSNNIRRYLPNKRDQDLIYGDRFFEVNDFYQTGETYMDSSKILIIDYERKGQREKQLRDTASSYFFPQGRIFINTADNAIIRMEDWFGGIQKRSDDFSRKFTIENQYSQKVTYEYKKQRDGKYYLNWIEKSEIKTDNKYSQCLLFVNEVPFENTRSMKVKGKFLFSKEIDLYDADIKYNENFWKNYNGVLLNPLNEKVLRDMQRIRPLDDQFRTN